MLIFYGGHGSPGASMTAVHVAAHWAKSGREVLLIEADPTGGSLSHHLGIQFTPGAASFVASGLPVLSSNLIDHSQDILFEDLHIMPSPSSPTGARGIVESLEARAEDLRAISESDMAVIIDGGRVAADIASAPLTVHAAGLVVVVRGGSSPASLEHLGELLDPGSSGGGPRRHAVIIGESSLSPDEWEERCGLTLCGTIPESAELAASLSAQLGRNSRRVRKWQRSVGTIADSLLPFARPQPSGERRSPGGAEAVTAVPPTVHPAPPPTPPPPADGSPPPAYVQPPPIPEPVGPAAQQAAAYEQPPTEAPPLPSEPPIHRQAPPGYEPFAPPAEPWAYGPPPSEYQQSGAPPWMEGHQFYDQFPPPEPPVYGPAPQSQPGPPAYDQPPPPPAPPAYGQPPPQPAQPPPAPPVYDRPPQSGYPPLYGPSPQVPEPAAGVVGQDPYAAPPAQFYQQHPVPPPFPPQQPPAAPAETPAPVEIDPSGSFREMAARLYGLEPRGHNRALGEGGGDVS